MSKALRPITRLASGGPCLRRRTPALLPLLAALVGVIAATLWSLAQIPVALGDPASFESAGPATEALLPEVSTAGRDTSGQRKDGARPEGKTALKLQSGTLLPAAAVLRSRATPQRFQSFLSCRTRNPRDPPAA